MQVMRWQLLVSLPPWIAFQLPSDLGHSIHEYRQEEESVETFHPIAVSVFLGVVLCAQNRTRNPHPETLLQGH